jgi:hypothetical protein
MNSWIAKFLISAALDPSESGKPFSSEPARVRAAVPRSELAQFEQSIRVVDHRLKAARPAQDVPPDLHAQIMGAVRAESRKAASSQWRLWRRWLPAPALAVLAFIVVWQAPDAPEPAPVPPQTVVRTPSLSGAAAALEFGHNLAQKAPLAAVAPLEQEMEMLAQDLLKTAEFLLASLP